MYKGLLSLIAATLLWALTNPTAAQPADGVYRVGFLSWGMPRALQQRLAAFRQGMADLGHIEGRNFSMLERFYLKVSRGVRWCSRLK